MQQSAPDGFDLKSFYEGIYLFQRWELFPGIETDGPKDVVATLAAMDFPADLTGKRVLDIGPWNGFFSFECARRGAAEVVSVGPEDPYDTGFAQTRDLLGLDNVRYVRASLYDLTPEDHGQFDIVLFLGVIYHLRHPLLALDILYEMCLNMLFVDTPFIDNLVYDRLVDDETKQKILENGQVIHQLPMLYLSSGVERTGDAYNWFMPNLLAFRDMVRLSGFDVTREANDGGGWCWIGAVKGTRPFVPKLEGYNAAAARG